MAYNFKKNANGTFGVINNKLNNLNPLQLSVQPKQSAPKLSVATPTKINNSLPVQFTAPKTNTLSLQDNRPFPMRVPGSSPISTTTLPRPVVPTTSRVLSKAVSDGFGWIPKTAEGIGNSVLSTAKLVPDVALLGTSKLIGDDKSYKEASKLFNNNLKNSIPGGAVSLLQKTGNEIAGISYAASKIPEAIKLSNQIKSAQKSGDKVKEQFYRDQYKKFNEASGQEVYDYYNNISPTVTGDVGSYNTPDSIEKGDSITPAIKGVAEIAPWMLGGSSSRVTNALVQGAIGGTTNAAMQLANGQPFDFNQLGQAVAAPAAFGALMPSKGNKSTIVKQADEAHINMANALDNATDPVAKQSIVNDMIATQRAKALANSPELATTKYNVNKVNPNEAYTLADYSEMLNSNSKFLKDTTNPSTIDSINQLNQQARNVANTAGIDITSGSKMDIQNRITDFMEQYDNAQNPSHTNVRTFTQKPDQRGSLNVGRIADDLTGKNKTKVIVDPTGKLGKETPKVDSLNARKTQLEEQIARMESKQNGYRNTDMPGVFQTGRDGISASRLRKLDQQTNRTIDDAVKYTKVYDELKSVNSQIKGLESVPARAEQAAKTLSKQQEMFNNIKVGDSVDVGGNGLITVAKVNKNSITTPSGSKYKIDEIYSVKPSTPAPQVTKTPVKTKELKTAVDSIIQRDNPELGYTGYDSQFPDGIPKIKPSSIREATGLSAAEAGIPPRYLSEANGTTLDKVALDMEYKTDGGELKLGVDDALDAIKSELDNKKAIRDVPKKLAELRRDPNILTEAQAALKTEKAIYGMPDDAYIPTENDYRQLRRLLNREDSQAKVKTPTELPIVGKPLSQPIDNIPAVAKQVTKAKTDQTKLKTSEISQTTVTPIEPSIQSKPVSSELPTEVKTKIDDLVSSSKLSPNAYNDALNTPLSQVLGDMKSEADPALPTFNAVAASGRSRSGKKLVDAINSDSTITKAAIDAQQTGRAINFFAKKDKNGRSVGIERFNPKYQKIEAGFVTDVDGNILGNHIKVDETGIQVNVGGDLVNLNRIIGNPNDWKGKYKVSETMSRNIDANAPNKKIAQQTKDFVIGGKVKAEANFKTELSTEYKNLGDRIKLVKSARPSGINKKVYNDDIFSVLNGDKTDADIRLAYDKPTAKTILDYKKQTRKLYDSLLERVNKERVKFGQEPIEPRKNYITHLQELSNSKSFVGEVASGLKNSFADEGMQTTRSGVPGNIAGRTEQFKPTSAYNKFMQARKGTKSLRDPFLAVQEYLEPALYNIHMTEPTIRARAVESAFRTASELKNYSGDKTIRDFNGFVKPYQAGGDNAKLVAGFQEYANTLAKKTNRFDRPIIDASAATANILKGSQALQRIGGRGTVIGNASSVLSQALGQPVAIADAGIGNYLKGIAKSVGGDKAILQSPFINARKTQVVKPIRGIGTKIMDAGGVPLQKVELGFVELTWNTQHAKALSKGYKGMEAIKQADFNTERVVAGRGIADKPEIYRSTAANNLLQYTLEVSAQYKAVMKDFTPAQKVTFIVAAFAMNQVYQLATGTKPLPDFLGAAIDTGVDLADQEDTTSGAEKALTGGKKFLGEAVKMNPFASVAANTLLSQDQRKQFFGSEADVARYEGTSAPVQVVRNAFDAANYAAQGNWTASRDSALKVVPFGNQARKSVQGLESNFRGYNVDKSGNPTYAVSTDPISQVKNVLFGPNSDPNAVKYYKNNNVSLTNKQTETLKTLPKTDQLDYLKQITDTRASNKQTDKEVKALEKSSVDTKTLTTGEIAYKDIDGKWTTAKDQSTADKAIAKQKTDKIKDEFDKSGKNFLEKDGYVYRRNSDGSVATPITKDEYDYKVGSATLTKQKRNDDVNGWVKTANSQLDSIEKQLNDPSVDELDKLQLEDDAQVLIDSIQKYTEYGGFTKPKSGSSKSASIAKILAANKNISDTTASTMKKLNALLASSAPTKPTIRKATLKAITVRGAKS